MARYKGASTLFLLYLVLLFYLWKEMPKLLTTQVETVKEKVFEPSQGPFRQSPAVRARPPGPIHKQFLNVESPHSSPQIVDTFQYKTLPDVPSWNKPPKEHVVEKTPLFIGFTRNWLLLQQCVLSYITAGWPAEDIYVVDNTGTMKSNFSPKSKITLQNPSYLNVDRLTNVFGVKVISTPTLLTFAQLQNFYIYTALENGWENYFWSHMDVVVFSDEDLTHAPLNQQRDPATSHKSLYMRAVEELRKTSDPSYAEGYDGWGIRFFEYDWLALNNMESFVKMGGWDPMISYYSSDCDMYQRLQMSGVMLDTAEAGWVIDVGRTIDLNLFFRRKYNPDMPPKTAAEMNALAEDEMGGEGFKRLLRIVRDEAELKNSDPKERNNWQQEQLGGKGEPFHRDPRGFEQALKLLIRSGEEIYAEKWGHTGCDLRESGLQLEDAWMVEHDWE
ncbi:hypothetical protein SS1G_10910 [Sclerotinia sclerotiorum 1980 UF-70]|uniref:Nucleotide-diphospho-sugar transferase domain-containing protein n=2 Tax=Sclerotinia sclerotiorum (strain ATCC 18683 / 1980 / Ss-1) TaxID=665079 RepID=A7EZZ3_SCLS1|nr:hypothetical protein SS1G_10910 [Sclerotinia sclerotiorum 1980 UF-70]APA12124.1 hypothetical protein sscle_09g068940 [Sclerotinia sclerotiorum 1980 UF-70]EDN95035.1 hypothetical protein SS1G_10910 [Sclerotinia sclerotiorum 1980 UF-70]